jgi:polysaccharide biosynthesis transport protein
MSAGQENKISRVGPPPRPVNRAAPEQASLFQVIWRGKWIILFTSVLGFACAYFYVDKMPKVPIYQSSAAVLIEKPYSLGNSDVPLPVGGTASNYLTTHASMIKSRKIINAALNAPNVFALPSLADVNNPAAYLHEALSVNLVKGTDIFSISAEAPYPDDAATMVNAVIKAYIQWHNANKQTTTTDLLKDLNLQLDKRQKELTSKRQELAVFEKKMMVKSQGGLNSDLLSTIQKNLEEVRMNEIHLDSYHKGLLRFENEPDVFRKFVNSKQGLVPIAVQSDERTQIEGQLATIRMQLDEFEAGEIAVKHSAVELQIQKVERLEERIAQLDREFITQHLSLTQDLLEDTRMQLKQFQKTYEEKLTEAIGNSEWNSEHSRLVSESQMSERICNSILDQINELDLGSNLQSLNIHVLEQAIPSSAPVPIDDTKTYGLGLMLGLASGAGLAALREFKDKRIRSAGEITGSLGLPVLGIVPTMSKIKKDGFIARSQRLKFASNSSESEAYRSIRTSILFGGPGDQPTTVLVTSSARSEGRTTLASNLGVAMAQIGLKTLVLDTDLRKPALQRIFMKDKQYCGLAEVLAGTATLDEAIGSTETEKLDVLTSGKCPENPSEVLNSPGFKNVLQQLKKKYDCVLIDSSPVGLFTDAQVIATYCDLTLLVLRADKTNRPDALLARDALLSVGTLSLGCVVNRVSGKNNRFVNSSIYGHFPQPGTGVASLGNQKNGKRNKRRISVPVDSQSSGRPQRRYFTPAYKAGVVEKAMACTSRGEIKVLLEQEGLHSSSLAKWRKQYLAGALGPIGDSRSTPEENEEADQEKHASAVNGDPEAPARIIVPDSWPMR